VPAAENSAENSAGHTHTHTHTHTHREREREREKRNKEEKRRANYYNTTNTTTHLEFAACMIQSKKDPHDNEKIREHSRHRPYLFGGTIRNNVGNVLNVDIERETKKDDVDKNYGTPNFATKSWTRHT
jgi:hypothetical protein